MVRRNRLEKDGWWIRTIMRKEDKPLVMAVKGRRSYIGSSVTNVYNKVYN